MMTRLFYFILGLSLPVLIATAPQLGGRFKNAYEIEREFTNVYQSLRNNEFKIETSTPTMDFLGENQPILVYSGDALNFVVKVKNRKFMFSGIPF